MNSLSGMVFDLMDDETIDFCQSREYRVSRTKGICYECKDDNLILIQKLTDSDPEFTLLCPKCDTAFVSVLNEGTEENTCLCKQSTEQKHTLN